MSFLPCIPLSIGKFAETLTPTTSMVVLCRVQLFCRHPDLESGSGNLTNSFAALLALEAKIKILLLSAHGLTSLASVSPLCIYAWIYWALAFFLITIKKNCMLT